MTDKTSKTATKGQRMTQKTRKKTELYILHGWTYRPEPWEQVVEKLKAQGVTAHFLRTPGLGTPSDEVFTIDDYVAWADKNLPKNAIALGHSNGGRILLNLLSQKGSSRLRGLILLDAAGIYEKSKKRDLARAASKLLAPLKKIPYAREIVHRLLGASDYGNAPENMKKTLANMLDSDKHLDLTQISTPTEIIWGEDDQTTPMRQGYAMHARLKNSKLTVKPGWRHSHYLVSVDELATEIVRAFKDLEAKK